MVGGLLCRRHRVPPRIGTRRHGAERAPGQGKTPAWRLLQVDAEASGGWFLDVDGGVDVAARREVETLDPVGRPLGLGGGLDHELASTRSFATHPAM